MTRLLPMAVDEFSTFFEDSIPAYAADKVRAGQWSLGESLLLSRQSFEALLPNGLDTPRHRLFSVVDDSSAVVGAVWIAEQERAGVSVAYLYNIRIAPAYQRLGHATRALQALESMLPALGLSGIALHVFGHNTSAHALYVRLGYQTTNIMMFKHVPACSSGAESGNETVSY